MSIYGWCMVRPAAMPPLRRSLEGTPEGAPLAVISFVCDVLRLLHPALRGHLLIMQRHLFSRPTELIHGTFRILIHPRPFRRRRHTGVVWPEAPGDIRRPQGHH